MLGLKRGTVELYAHEAMWEEEAKLTIAKLKGILGASAVDIQHVGSTAIKSIKAKPIIDIAVAVRNFDDIMVHERELRSAGFYHRPADHRQTQLLFACGSRYDGTGDMQTHFIHVVIHGSKEWTDYINFRNYLNKFPEIAAEYEALKIRLTSEITPETGREKYRQGKAAFVTHVLRKAQVHFQEQFYDSYVEVIK